MRVFYTDEVLERMRKLFDVNTNKELSSLLATKETTVSSWKSRNSIPLEILLSVANQKNISLDYLVFGDEQKPNNSIDEEMVLIAYKKMPKDKKLEAIAFLSGLNSENTARVNQTIRGNGTNISGGLTIQK